MTRKWFRKSLSSAYDRGMTENEKYIAYTRALSELAVIAEEDGGRGA